jgi:hypothetical protein
MFKPIPDNDANETYEVVPASYPAGWWKVTAQGIPIRHFGRQGESGAVRQRPGISGERRQPETVAAAVRASDRS